MSMKEFEKQENNRERESSFFSIQGCNSPGDFTEEDQAFARELNALFSPEEEELPPYYVQTLLDVDDQRFEPVERGFEYKTSARVFRRLKLRRRLFYTHASPLSVFSSGMSNASTRRSLLTVAATFVLIMLLTVAFTGPSFASGVAILLRGTHGSGVLGVIKYPQAVTRHAPNVLDSPQELSPLAAQRQLHFSMYWPEEKPLAYTLENINLYIDLNQQWADGPMLEFEYRLPPSSVASKGTGEIWIREFKPKADVLQLVKQGASVPIQMDNNGRALAIYIDGQWDPRGKNTPVWVYGQRSELMYQINGVVFWIVGDQRDGIGEQQLMHIAQGLTPHSLPLDRQYRMGGDAISITQLNDDVPGPFSNDVIMIFPTDGSDGPYYMSVSSYQPPKTAH